MSYYRLVLSENTERALRALLMRDSPLENGAAMLLGTGAVNGGRALFARTIVEAPAGGFRMQEQDRWAPSPSWLSRLVGVADENSSGIALVHSHPLSSDAVRSAADDWADELIAPYFSSNLGERPFASLVVSKEVETGSKLSLSHYGVLRVDGYCFAVFSACPVFLYCQ